MSGGQKPAIKVVLVNKADKSQKRGLLAAWVRDDGNGFSGKADKDVVAIKFADGTVWKAADVYVNVYDNRESSPPQRAHRPAFMGAPPQTGGGGDDAPPDFGDDDVPFVTSSVVSRDANKARLR